MREQKIFVERNKLFVGILLISDVTTSPGNPISENSGRVLHAFISFESPFFINRDVHASSEQLFLHLNKNRRSSTSKGQDGFPDDEYR